MAKSRSRYYVHKGVYGEYQVNRYHGSPQQYRKIISYLTAEKDPVIFGPYDDIRQAEEKARGLK